MNLKLGRDFESREAIEKVLFVGILGSGVGRGESCFRTAIKVRGIALFFDDPEEFRSLSCYFFKHLIIINMDLY